MGLLDKPITTQEELDAIIGERLAQKDRSIEKKYGDYEETKKKVAEYEASLAEQSKLVEEASKKAESHEKLVAELTEKVKRYETDSVKTKIAHELKLPYELAGRLSGTTEDEIRADAENLSRLLSAQREPAPLADTESVKSGDSGYRGLVNSLLKGE